MKSFIKIVSLLLAMCMIVPLSVSGLALSEVQTDLTFASNDPLLYLNDTGNIVHDPGKVLGRTIENVIDVSYANGSINWSQVKSDGVNFAFIRAGYRGYSSGDICTDSQFTNNMVGAISAGVKVGIYFYSQAITTDEARDEADYVLRLVNGYKLDLPIVFDFEFAEDGGKYTGRLYKAFLGKSSMTDICLAFCDRVSAAGYDAMVYANPYMLTERLIPETITAQYQIWLANYVDETSYSGDYTMWQFSSKGSVNGISGNVDRSFWYKPVVSPSTHYIKLTSECPDIIIGETERINTFRNEDALYYSTAIIGSVQWMSSNEEIATVDQNGVVTAVTAGDVVISAKYNVTIPANHTVEGSTDSNIECIETLNFTCVEKPVEPEETSSILQMIIETFVLIVKFILSLFNSVA